MVSLCLPLFPHPLPLVPMDSWGCSLEVHPFSSAHEARVVDHGGSRAPGLP